jgi:hypothetical protein
MGYTVFSVFSASLILTRGTVCELDFSIVAGIDDDSLMLASHDYCTCTR